MNEKGRTVSVGSGDLLGDRTQAIECPRSSDTRVPDARTKISLPIRGFELLGMLAGKEPFTSTASHALGLDFSAIIGNVACAKGAEEPNVKDEPREGLARLVALHEA